MKTSEFMSLLVAIIIAVSFAIFSFGNAIAFQNMMLAAILISVIDIQHRRKGGEK